MSPHRIASVRSHKKLMTCPRQSCCHRGSNIDWQRGAASTIASWSGAPRPPDGWGARITDISPGKPAWPSISVWHGTLIIRSALPMAELASSNGLRRRVSIKARAAWKRNHGASCQPGATALNARFPFIQYPVSRTGSLSKDEGRLRLNRRTHLL